MKIFGSQIILQGITNTCHESYDRTDTKLGPEAFRSLPAVNHFMRFTFMSIGSKSDQNRIKIRNWKFVPEASRLLPDINHFMRFTFMIGSKYNMLQASDVLVIV